MTKKGKVGLLIAAAIFGTLSVLNAERQPQLSPSAREFIRKEVAFKKAIEQACLPVKDTSLYAQCYDWEYYRLRKVYRDD